VLYYKLLYRVVLYCIVLFCVVLYCIILYCVVLDYILFTPKFNYADYDVDGSARCHHLDFLKYRIATPFYRNLFISDAYFAVRFFLWALFFVAFCPFKQLQTLVFFLIYKYHFLRQK
jgi:hypothetical protein